MTNRHILEDLRRVDPAAHISDGPLDARARADLARILHAETLEPTAARAPKPGTRSSRPANRRRTLTLAASVAVVAAAVTVGLPIPGGGGGVAYAATPPLLPSELNTGTDPDSDIARLVANAVKSPAAPATSTINIHLEGWSLVAGEKVHPSIEPQITDITRNGDDSGTHRTVIGKGSGDQPLPPGQVLAERTFGPGEFDGFYPRELSSDPRTLLGQLKAGHPIDDIGTTELIVAIEDLHREQIPGPGVRAAMLRLLGERPDVMTLGQMTDRAGRTGTALAVDSSYTGGPTRYVMIFDDKDGRLLATEDVLTQAPPKLQVAVPAVVSYELFNKNP